MKEDIPSEEVADTGLAEVPPSVVEGESTPDVPAALPSRCLVSITLIFGSETSEDMTMT